MELTQGHGDAHPPRGGGTMANTARINDIFYPITPTLAATGTIGFEQTMKQSGDIDVSIID